MICFKFHCLRTVAVLRESNAVSLERSRNVFTLRGREWICNCDAWASRVGYASRYNDTGQKIRSLVPIENGSGHHGGPAGGVGSKEAWPPSPLCDANGPLLGVRYRDAGLRPRIRSARPRLGCAGQPEFGKAYEHRRQGVSKRGRLRHEQHRIRSISGPAAADGPVADARPGDHG